MHNKVSNVVIFLSTIFCLLLTCSRNKQINQIIQAENGDLFDKENSVKNILVENESSNNIEIELLKDDYKIINYTETKNVFYNNIDKIIIDTKEITKILNIEITNSEKSVQLKNAIHPVIWLELNNKKNYAKGHNGFASNTPYGYYYFFIDNNGKIMDFENNIIPFIEDTIIE